MFHFGVIVNELIHVVKFLLVYEVPVTGYSELQRCFSIWSRGGDRERDLKDRNSADKKCLLNKYGPKYKSFFQT